MLLTITEKVTVKAEGINNGDLDKAIEHFKKALEIRRKKLGEDHPKTKALLEDLRSITE